MISGKTMENPLFQETSMGHWPIKKGLFVFKIAASQSDPVVGNPCENKPVFKWREDPHPTFRIHVTDMICIYIYIHTLVIPCWHVVDPIESQMLLDATSCARQVIHGGWNTLSLAVHRSIPWENPWLPHWTFPAPRGATWDVTSASLAWGGVSIDDHRWGYPKIAGLSKKWNIQYLF